MKRKRFGDRSDEMIEKKPRKKKFLILVVIFLILLCLSIVKAFTFFEFKVAIMCDFGYNFYS